MSTRNINVVVVGVSVAGLKVAKAIAALSKQGFPNLSVTAIDKNEYFYHAIAAPRATVDLEFGKKLFFPLADILQEFELNPAEPKHKFIQTTLTSINNAQKTIQLSNGQTVAFDYLVLATGAKNKSPAHYEGATVTEAHRNMEETFGSIKKAKDILIIGGGAVGIEIAGEIAAAYKDKKITLVHSAERLLPLNFKHGISNGAVDKLQRLGVEVVLNEKIKIPEDVPFNCRVRPLTLTGTSGREYASDLQILATGTTVHTEYMESLEGELGEHLRNDWGGIKVRKTLQANSKSLPNIFVPGDCNALPAGYKFAYLVGAMSTVVATNIIAMINAGFDEDSTKKPTLVEYTGGPMNIMFVPIGPNLGVAQIMGIAFGKSFMGNVLAGFKSKDYFYAKIAAEVTDAVK
ncbi:hypothetical protein GGF37_005761 [Kickxella alabastrina]|nr:hypothetical protein GGF37_005761 [Kickxella alabastrina]